MRFTDNKKLRRFHILINSDFWSFSNYDENLDGDFNCLEMIEMFSVQCQDQIHPGRFNFNSQVYNDFANFFYMTLMGVF